MIRERHVILTAALHSRLAVSYIHDYAVLPSIIIVIYNFLLVRGTYNYSYSYLASFPSSYIVQNYDTTIIQV